LCRSRLHPSSCIAPPLPPIESLVRILLPSVLILLGSLAASACATTAAVPRPYPGAQPAGTSRAPSADAGRVPEEPAGSAATTGTPVAAALAPRPAAEAVVDVAQGFLGTPYRSGGADPEGFDCSGFVQYVYARAGIALPRSVREQWLAGSVVDAGDVRRGDLLFFTIGGREVTHVGIALDTDTFVHAPSARGVVRVERSSVKYWAKRYAGARRVTE
jgi:cell wall-associated NlpC family hydrolase